VLFLAGSFVFAVLLLMEARGVVSLPLPLSAIVLYPTALFIAVRIWRVLRGSTRMLEGSPCEDRLRLHEGISESSVRVLGNSGRGW
jgi:hypothetical protein